MNRFDFNDYGPEDRDAGRRVRAPVGLYLRGPIPWSWLGRCGQLRGQALQVALALWIEAGLTRSRCVRLRWKHLAQLRTSRRSVGRALERMEDAGLVRVSRRPGRLHEVEILDVQEVAS